MDVQTSRNLALGPGPVPAPPVVSPTGGRQGRGPAPAHDLIDEMVYGFAVAPENRIVEANKKKFAIYARYSSENQDYDSIMRQLRRCRKYLSDIGVKNIEEFVDEARSGTSVAGREKLQELLARIREFDGVCFEHFSRWSREAYDGSELCEFLELNDVEVHVALLGQRVAKDEIMKGVMDAERDVQNRRAWTMGGADELVHAGGMPFGACYGYKPTDVPGFPEPDEFEAEVVLKIFSLAAGGMSDVNIAALLTAKNIPSPAGGMLWIPGSVRQIRRRPIYMGRIYYRRTGEKRKRKSTIRVRFKRDPSKVVRGYNEDFRIVSDDLYYKANLKNYNRRADEEADERGTLYKSCLVAMAICDCPGKEGQRFYNSRSRKQSFLTCSLARRGKTCAHERLSIDYVSVERAVVDEVRKRISEGYGGTAFAESYEARLNEVLAHHDAHRSKLSDELQVEEAVANRMMMTAFREKSLSSRSEQLLQQQEDKVSALRSALAGMRDLGSALDAMPARLVELRRALDVVKERLPFEIGSPSDEVFVTAFRKVVPRVIIERHQMPLGAMRLRIEFDAAATYLGEEADVIGTVSETMSVDLVREGRRRYASNLAAQQRADERARSGLHALTDAQWAFVQPHLPEWSAGVGVDARTAVDAMVFVCREGIPHQWTPPRFGDRREVYRAMTRLTYAGVPGILEEILGPLEPAELPGPARPRGKLSELPAIRPGMQGNRVRAALTARRLLDDGPARLTDDEWGSLEGAVTRGLVNPRGGCPSGLGPRQLIEAMLLRVRTRATWSALGKLYRLPSTPGNNALRAIAGRAITSGSWDRVVEICRREHPRLVEGADLTLLDRQRSFEAKRLEAMRAWHLKNRPRKLPERRSDTNDACA